MQEEVPQYNMWISIARLNINVSLLVYMHMLYYMALLNNAYKCKSSPDDSCIQIPQKTKPICSFTQGGSFVEWKSKHTASWEGCVKFLPKPRLINFLVIYPEIRLSLEEAVLAGWVTWSALFSSL